MYNQAKKCALVTGADRGLGLSLARDLAKAGWQVYAGRILSEYTLLDDLHKDYPNLIPVWLDVSKPADICLIRDRIAQDVGYLDLLVSNAALMGGNGAAELGGVNPIDFDAMELSFRINSLAAPLLVDILFPLLEKGNMKRLFFTSSEISSIKLMHRTGDMRYAMTKAALNLGVRMLHNSLRPLGYTFRLYQPGWMKRVQPDGTRSESGNVDPDDSARVALSLILEERPDEDRLILIDRFGHELAF
ncbi:MAG: SDR family NAD(P)-dependent oxidoreductase [Clostridia bacterium]|nr:SDR family NAD(P)-dependent oxidoreductase [Clostridia bacterium]